jgi:cytochrome c peroxidase
MLLGRLEDTAPYGWNGAGKDLTAHVAETQKRLSGTGITAAERQALIVYVSSLRAPEPTPRRDTAVEQGEELFHSQGTGCASCHLGDDALTDRLKHDVKSRGRGDPERAFDTPSLRFVGRSAPYFHDGRYATLGDVLRGAEGTMGHTAHLSPFDLAALEAYLASL